MKQSSREMLLNPHPRSHIVYPYTKESEVADAVCLFAGAGLRNREAVLLIMTEAHHGPVRQRLEDEGFDLAPLEASGQLVFEDAESLLASFLIDGVLDEPRLKTALEDTIADAKAGGRDRGMRIFGELAPLVWTSNPQVSQRLEELANEVIEAHSVSILCAYALSGEHPALTPALLACHSHAIA